MSLLSYKQILIRILEGEVRLLRLQDKEVNQINELITKLREDKEVSKEELESIFLKLSEEEHKEFMSKEIKNLSDPENISFEQKIRLSKEEKLPIFIHNFDVNLLGPANYDLRLGEDAYVTTGKLPRKLSSVNDTVAIEPGEFGILTTYESIYVPHDLMGLISLRVRYKTQGLVNISGFHVDPGFEGKIIFSVYNAGPRNVVLRYKDPIFMIMYEKLESPVKEGYEVKGTFSKGPLENIPSDIVTTLSGPSVSVISLDKKIKRLEIQVIVNRINN